MVQLAGAGQLGPVVGTTKASVLPFRHNPAPARPRGLFIFRTFREEAAPFDRAARRRYTVKGGPSAATDELYKILGEAASMAGARPGENESTHLIYGERRAALMRSAITVVARDGLRSLTYRSLAREAGVSHGLIAHHFGSLDSLLTAALDMTIDESAVDLDLIPPTSDIASFARDLVSGVPRQAENLAFQYQVMLEARSSGDVAGRVRALHDRYRGILSEALEKMLVPNDPGMVELVYASLEGVAFHQLVHVESSANELAVERLRDLLRSARRR